MTDQSRIHINRFREKLGLFVGSGETVYITTQEAARLISILAQGIASLEKDDFKSNDFGSHTIIVKTIE